MRISIFSTHMFIVTIIIVLGICGATGFIFWRLVDNVSRVQGELNDLEREIAQREQGRTSLKSMSGIITTRQSDLDRISNFLIDHSQPVYFVEQLEALAKDTHNIFTIDIDEGKSSDQNTFFRLTVEGTESSAFTYLKLLELMPYRIEVQEIILQSISPDEAARSAPVKSKLFNQRPTHRLTLLIKVGSR